MGALNISIPGLLSVPLPCCSLVAEFKPLTPVELQGYHYDPCHQESLSRLFTSLELLNLFPSEVMTEQECLMQNAALRKVVMRFKLKTVVSIVSSIRQDLMASLDLKKVYFQNTVHQEFRKYLHFVLVGLLYHSVFWPFSYFSVFMLASLGIMLGHSYPLVPQQLDCDCLFPHLALC